MLTVIFGAGASHDADPFQPEKDAWRLPLTNEVVEPRASFGEALTLYPRCVPLIAQLRNMPAGASLEERLDFFDKAAETYPAGLVELAAFRFYLRWIMWKCGEHVLKRTNHVTNYVALLAVIDRWAAQTKSKVNLLSFNYDTLLDDACLYSLRMRLRQISDYLTESDRYKVLKLHGSWNWVRRIANEFEGIPLARQVISQIDDIELTDRYHVFENKPGRQAAKGPVHEPMVHTVSSKSGPSKSYGVFPALALPLRSKAGFDCPPAQVQELPKAIAGTRGLVVVGWRAQEEHFLQELKANIHGSTEVHIVSGTAAGGQRIRERLAAAGVKGNYSFFPGGFTDYVRSDSLSALLATLAKPKGAKRKRPRTPPKIAKTSEAQSAN